MTYGNAFFSMVAILVALVVTSGCKTAPQPGEAASKINANARASTPSPGPATPAPAVIPAQRDRLGRTTPATVAAAQSQATLGPKAAQLLRKRLMPFLSGFEYVPVKKDLMGLGTPEALIRVLTEIYQDTSVNSHHRTQALACLRFFPRPDVQAIYESVLTDPTVKSVFRRSVTSAYAAGFGQAAFATTQALLVHADMHTRNLAVKALARIGGVEAVDALKAHLAREKAAKVQRTLKQILTRLQKFPTQ